MHTNHAQFPGRTHARAADRPVTRSLLLRVITAGHRISSDGNIKRTALHQRRRGGRITPAHLPVSFYLHRSSRFLLHRRLSRNIYRNWSKKYFRRPIVLDCCTVWQENDSISDELFTSRCKDISVPEWDGDPWSTVKRSQVSSEVARSGNRFPIGHHPTITLSEYDQTLCLRTGIVRASL